MIRRVVGESMMPSLPPGSFVVGLRFKKPQLNEIVLASHNGREIIKRVAKLGPDGYYLLGDNLEASTDSRKYGWIPKKNIHAVVIWTSAS